MLLRSSSTPFLHSSVRRPSSSSPFSSLHLPRAFSDSHLPSLHPSSAPINDDDTTATGGLHTELSFSVYTTFGKQGAPLAAPQPPHDQFGFEPPEHQEQEDDQSTATTLPELPLFLARGLGIDRIASGLFTAGGVVDKPKMDEKVAALDNQYKKMVDEQPGNALFLRNYAQFLHEVKGDAKRAEEYYSRAMLADPTDGEIMSKYAKLIWDAHRDRERSLTYFHKSVQAAPQNSHVLAAYASFLWEQDDDDFEEGEQGTGAASPEHATGAGYERELTSAAF